MTDLTLNSDFEEEEDAPAPSSGGKKRHKEQGGTSKWRWTEMIESQAENLGRFRARKRRDDTPAPVNL